MKQLTILMTALVIALGVTGCGENTEPKKVQQMAANSTDQSLENAVKDSSDKLKDATSMTVDPKADIETTDNDNADATTGQKEEATTDAKDAIDAADQNNESTQAEQPKKSDE